MNLPADEIELVVREVLAQLGAAPSARSAPGVAIDPAKSISQNTSPLPDNVAASGERPRARAEENVQDIKTFPSTSPHPSPLPKGEEASVRGDAGVVTVAARVVTLREIADRLPTMRRLVVSREAVVTPAVRDELLRRGIDLQRTDAAGHRPAPVRLALKTSGTDFDPTALAAALQREGFRVECSASDCLIAATESLAAELTSSADTLGVLFTAHTAAGLCLANRLPGVRAIGGGTAPSVAAAAAAVGANLLVVDPRAGTFHQLKQSVAEFAAGGVRPCPEALRKKLA